MAEWWETEEFEVQEAAPAAAPEAPAAEWWEESGPPPAPPAPTPAPEPEPAERQVAPGIWSKRSLGEIIAGGAEVAGTLLSSAVAEPVSGVAGLGAAVFGDQPGAGGDTVRAVQEAMTYQPRGEAGQEYLADAAELLQPVGEGFSAVEDTLGDTVLELTGSPEAAAIAHSAPTAVIEALGLGLLRKGSKAADAAIDAQERVKVNPGMTAAEVADEMIAPEDLSYQQLTEKLKSGELKDVAKQVRPDREVMEAADTLGVDLNPGHYSTNEAFIRTEQAIKSQPDSTLAAREAEAIKVLGERADELIEKTGGDLDRTLLDDSVRAEMDGTITALGDQAEQVYSKVREKIPVGAKSQGNASQALVGTRLRELGGDVSGLTPPERALHDLFSKKYPPTFGRLDALRQEIAEGYKRKGVFADASTGSLDQVYKAVNLDQQAMANDFGAGKLLKAGRKLVSTRKGLEGNATKLLGKELEKSITSKLTQAAGSLTKGDVQKFKHLMEALPESQRPRAAATMLNDLFMSGARTRGGSIGQGFANAYSALERNAGAKRELFKYLPEDTQRRFDAIGKVSQGLYRAKALENTSRTARDVLRALAEMTLPDKLMAGAGKVGRTGPLRYVPGLGAAAEAAEVMAKRQKNRAKKADELMSSAAFDKSMRLAMEDRVREANMMLNRSAAWKAYKKTLGEATLQQLTAMGPIAWLTQQDDPERQQRAGNVPEPAIVP